MPPRARLARGRPPAPPGGVVAVASPPPPRPPLPAQRAAALRRQRRHHTPQMTSLGKSSLTASELIDPDTGKPEPGWVPGQYANLTGVLNGHPADTWAVCVHGAGAAARARAQPHGHSLLPRQYLNAGMGGQKMAETTGLTHPAFPYEQRHYNWYSNWDRRQGEDKHRPVGIEWGEDSISDQHTREWMRRMSPRSVGLHPDLCSALASLGITHLTTAQSNALPHLVEGRDVQMATHPGSGKTMAAVCWIIDKQLKEYPNAPFSTVWMVPHEGLARQALRWLHALGRMAGVPWPDFAVLCVESKDLKRNYDEVLQRRPSVLIGTPNRLGDLVHSYDTPMFTMERETLQRIVIDEVDAVLPHNDARAPGNCLMEVIKSHPAGVDHSRLKWGKRPQQVMYLSSGIDFATKRHIGRYWRKANGVFVTDRKGSYRFPRPGAASNLPQGDPSGKQCTPNGDRRHRYDTEGTWDIGEWGCIGLPPGGLDHVLVPSAAGTEKWAQLAALCAHAAQRQASHQLALPPAYQVNGNPPSELTLVHTPPPLNGASPAGAGGKENGRMPAQPPDWRAGSWPPDHARAAAGEAAARESAAGPRRRKREWRDPPRPMPSKARAGWSSPGRHQSQWPDVEPQAPEGDAQDPEYLTGGAARLPFRALVVVDSPADARAAAAGLSAGGFAGKVGRLENPGAVELYADGALPVLIALPASVRGVDVPYLTHVFLACRVTSPVDYARLAGRVGRAGRSGVCVTVCDPGDFRALRGALRRLDADPIVGRVDARRGEVLLPLAVPYARFGGERFSALGAGEEGERPPPPLRLTRSFLVDDPKVMDLLAGADDEGVPQRLDAERNVFLDDGTVRPKIDTKLWAGGSSHRTLFSPEEQVVMEEANTYEWYERAEAQKGDVTEQGGGGVPSGEVLAMPTGSLLPPRLQVGVGVDRCGGQLRVEKDSVGERAGVVSDADVAVVALSAAQARASVFSEANNPAHRAAAA